MYIVFGYDLYVRYTYFTGLFHYFPSVAFLRLCCHSNVVNRDSDFSLSFQDHLQIHKRLPFTSPQLSTDIRAL